MTDGCKTEDTDGSSHRTDGKESGVFKTNRAYKYLSFFMEKRKEEGRISRTKK